MVSTTTSSRRYDGPRLILQVAVLLCAVQLGYWVVSAISAFRDGRMGLPVSVNVIGPGAEALGQLSIARVSPKGNESQFERVPSTSEFVAPAAWVSGIRVRGPAQLLGQIRALSIRIGSRQTTVERPTLQAASRAGESPARMDLDLGADARTFASVIHAHPFNALANWPGDSAFLKAVFGNRAFARAVICAIVAALLRASRHSGQAKMELLRRGVLLLLVAHALVFVFPAVLSRLTFPLSLEHLEGVQAVNTWTWMQGGHLYAVPTADGSGNIYTPAYYMLCRLWSAFAGFSLPSLRVLTWLLTIASATAAALIIKTLGMSARWGVLWLPVYLLFFPMLGWIDNANKDSLHVLLAMAGMASLSMALARTPATWRWWAVGAGGAWAVAFMTKQSHLVIVALVLGAMLVWARKQFWYVAGAFAVTTVALMTWAYCVWGPQFLDWIYVVPKGHALVARSAFDGAMQLLLTGAGFFGLSAAGGILALRSVPRHGSPLRARIQLLAVYAFGCLLMGFMSIAKVRGGEYALVPGIAACAVLVVFAFQYLPYAYCPALLLLLLPATAPPRPAISAEARQNAEHLIDLVRNTPGSVWVPLHPEVALVAGKQPHVPEFCVGEWTTAGRAYPESILQALRDRRLSMVITDFNLPDFFPFDYGGEPYRTLRQGYSVSRVIPLREAYVVQDGWTNIPRLVWTRKVVQSAATAMP